MITTNIRIIREQKQYAQGYLAAKLGISQNAYSKIELGHTALTVERLLLIAMILETDITNLYKQDIPAGTETQRPENYSPDK